MSDKKIPNDMPDESDKEKKIHRRTLYSPTPMKDLTPEEWREYWRIKPGDFRR